MRKSCLLFALACLLFAACKKGDTNVTVINNEAKPSYVVSGVHDVTVTNGQNNYISMPITLEYQDSAQENVTIAITGMPVGFFMDTTATFSGIPTYTCDFYFYDTTTVTTVTPGTYTITVTTTGTRTGVRTLTFKLRVLPEPSYATLIAGKYANSQNSCTGAVYTDSVSADQTVINKIYFSNFLNYGVSVYGTVTSSGTINIPTQTVNGYTFYGTGGYFLNGTSYYIYLGNITTIYMGNSYFCSTQMNH